MQIQPDDPLIIAPCGINCSLCRSYQRERLPCPSCRGGDTHKGKACLNCRIKNCEELNAEGLSFCFSCDRYPCKVESHLDERYRRRYGVSVLANLERIQAVGVTDFLGEEAAKWRCPECGARLCMHKPQCLTCGYSWLLTGDERG